MARAKLKDSDITEDLYRRLRLRFFGKGFILLEGVGDGAGFHNGGWSDAIAMQTWPSQGLRLYGFEVKASRQDWLRELNNPGKNATWQFHCHEWYVVAPKDVVQLPELPKTWGLLIPKGKDGLQIASRCQRETKTESFPLDIMAAIFRAADSERDTARRLLHNRITEEIRRDFQSSLDAADKAREAIAEKHHRLSSALGHGWESIEKLEARARMARELDQSDSVDQLTRMANVLEKSLNEIKKACQMFNDLKITPNLEPLEK